MIGKNQTINLDESELKFNYIRASGPGGQNVNKVATSVQLRFDLAHSLSLTEDIKIRLAQLGGSQVTADGVLIIEAKRYRTQEQNRSDAIQRLITLIQKASDPPKTRKATQPSHSSRLKRLRKKEEHSQVKQNRQIVKKENWD